MCCLDVTSRVNDMGARISEHLKEVEALPLMDWDTIFLRTVDMLPLFDRPAAEVETEAEVEPEPTEDVPREETPAKKPRRSDSSSNADKPFDWSPKAVTPPRKRVVVKKTAATEVPQKTPDKAKKNRKKKTRSPKNVKESRERGRKDDDDDGSPRP